MIMMMTMMMMMPTMFGSRVTHPVTEGAKSGGEGEDKTRRGASLKINQIRFSASCRTGRITWIAQCHCLLVSQSVPRCPNVFPGREVQSLRFVDGRSCQNPRDHLSLTGLSHHRATSTFPLFQSIITSAGRRAERIAPNQSHYCSCGHNVLQLKLPHSLFHGLTQL